MKANNLIAALYEAMSKKEIGRVTVDGVCIVFDKSHGNFLIEYNDKVCITSDPERDIKRLFA